MFRKPVVVIIAAAVCLSCSERERIADLDRRVTALEAAQNASSKAQPQPTDQSSVISAPTAPPAQEVTAPAQTPSTTLVMPTPAPPVEVVSVDARPAEHNDVYTEYGWKLVLHNNTNVQQRLTAEIKFLDADGYELTQAISNDLLISPSGTETFTGTRILGNALAARYAKLSTSVRPH